MKKFVLWFEIVAVITAALAMAVPALSQNPQTQTAPLFATNAKYTNGTSPGYWPTQQAVGARPVATGLNINVGPGTANCGSGTIIQYAGGTFALTASATNRIYLNTASSCAPAVKTTAFVSADIPIAVVVTSGSAITSILDNRTPFQVTGAGTVVWGGITGTLSDQTDLAAALAAKAPVASPTFTGMVTLPITGSVQCVHVDSSGHASGTGVDCGTGSGAGNLTPVLLSSITPGSGNVGQIWAVSDSIDCQNTVSPPASVPTLCSTVNTDSGYQLTPVQPTAESLTSKGKGMVELTDSSGPGDGTTIGGTTAILFQAYGNKGSNATLSNTWPYRGTRYSNSSQAAIYSVVSTGGSSMTPGTYALSFSGGGGTGAAGTITVTSGSVTSITLTDHGSGFTSAPTVTVATGGTPPTLTATLTFVNTGNSTCLDVFNVELYQWENPPDLGAKDYFQQCGLGDYFTMRGTIGWGTITNNEAALIAAQTAATMWAATPLNGKIFASNTGSCVQTSGTWTAFHPTLAGTTTVSGMPIYDVGMSGTTSSVMTCLTVPSSGSVYVAWYDDGSSAAASLSIDGVSAGTLSANAAGVISTNHSSTMIWGQRFPVTGSGAHTLVYTVTTGSFRPMFMVSPNPLYNFNGLQSPNYYVGGIALLDGGGDFVWQALNNDEANTAAQMKTDGFHVEFADIANGWPESAGSTSYFEYRTGTYPNGIACTGSFAPHFNNCGDTFNAWQFLRAAGKTPGPLLSIFGDGITTTDAPFGKGRKISANFSSLPKLNNPNVFTSSPQDFHTKDSSTVAVRIFATSSTPAPTVSQGVAFAIVGTNHCAVTLTVAAASSLFASTSQVGGTVQTPTDSGGGTFTLVRTDGSLNTWKETNLTSGSHTIDVANFCGGGDVIEVAAGGSVPTLDTATGGTFSNNPNPSTIGPLTTAIPNELLLAFSDHTQCFGSDYPAPNGYTFIGSLTHYNQASQAVAATVGSYSASWVPQISCLGGNPPTAYTLVAVKGGASGQTADLQQFIAENGTTVNGGIKHDGHPYHSGCTSAQVEAADGSGCINLSGGSPSSGSAAAFQTADGSGGFVGTSVTGIVKGNGTSVPGAATQTDLSAPGYILDSGAANAYVATLSPAIASYTTGLSLRVKIANSNTTTTPTLNVNGLGTKTIVKNGAAALVGGDVAAGQIQTFQYDGTNFQLLNPATVVNAVSPSSPIVASIAAGVLSVSCPTCGTASASAVTINGGSVLGTLNVTGNTTQACSDSSGSGTAQTCTTSTSFTPFTNACVVYTTTTTNSGAGLTVNVNSLGAKSVAIPSGSGWTTTLTASIIPANKPLTICYDGTNWNVQQTGTVAAASGYPALVSVSVSAANVLDLSSCFSSSYDTYSIYSDGPLTLNSGSNNVTTAFRFKVGGSFDTASNYYYNRSGGGGALNNDSKMILTGSSGDTVSTTNDVNFFQMTVSSVNSSAVKAGSWFWQGQVQGGRFSAANGYLYINTGVITGMEIFTTATFTGTVKCQPLPQ